MLIIVDTCRYNLLTKMLQPNIELQGIQPYITTIKFRVLFAQYMFTTLSLKTFSLLTPFYQMLPNLIPFSTQKPKSDSKDNF